MCRTSHGVIGGVKKPSRECGAGGDSRRPSKESSTVHVHSRTPKMFCPAADFRASATTARVAASSILLSSIDCNRRECGSRMDRWCDCSAMRDQAKLHGADRV